MARLFWYLLILAVVGVVVAAASWATAYNSVDTLLGAPPPRMGSQHISFVWRGLPQVDGHPRVWSFAFGPTVIPGASTVRIYVTPLGRIVRIEPPDLEARLQAFHRTGY